MNSVKESFNLPIKRLLPSIQINCVSLKSSGNSPLLVELIFLSNSFKLNSEFSNFPFNGISLSHCIKHKDFSSS